MTKAAKSLIAPLLLILLSCCASASERYQTTTLVENQAAHIGRDAKVLVLVAGDGKYINKVYEGSGAMARSAMVTALSRYSGNVSEVLSFVPEETIGPGSLGREADYMVYIKIHLWEDRATEWSGKPDSIEIEVRLLDGGDGRLVGSRLMKAYSSWVTLGGDHPQDLLVRPFGDYAASLYGGSPAGAS